ncbi:iron-only hydrogenase system regulator [Clostridium sp. AL.422]|uniref:TM1266 family iron-only hydrogenase system putative regulator n=1 Tax=Clostridium TaxID=1485 RepID=UPI00293DC4B4|nr:MULTISPECIES: TM1266 family iron-only hydrogenase system putative regulator [unclassified Clostridium]MDV4149478.1 iron-only hydrogenase system regulator [Clostridium sp. AL.422]
MKVAVVSAILEEPNKCNSRFNEVVASFRGKIKGRMGIPLENETSIISIVVVGSLNEINSLTGKLGNIEGVTVKTAIGKKEVGI